MVEIADRVWGAWREERDAFPDEPAMLLRFCAVGDVGDAERAIADTLRDVVDGLREAAGGAGVDECSFPGEWSIVRDVDGVLVQVVECDILERVLPAIARALARRAVEGVFDVAARPSVATPPRIASLLECRLRIRGRRLVPPDDGHVLWENDREALHALLAAAVAWCRRRGRAAAEAVSVGPAPSVAVAHGDDVLQRFREPAVPYDPIELSAVAADGFRILAFRQWPGDVSLIEGGAHVAAGGWRRALSELTALLGEHADLLAYACVKHGSDVTRARLGGSLRFDWPPRPELGRRAHDISVAAFADTHAPDAFAVQLLGRGYAGRVPDSSSWRRESVGSASLLLEHIDLDAWFDVPFVVKDNPTVRAEEMVPPAVLAQARRELSSILYTPTVLADLR